MPERPAVQGLSVDAPGARDRDDALWVERDGRGFVLTVSITDVTSHVALGSPDDEMAAARGLNLYGDGVRAAMFGEHVTTRLASLDPRVTRRVIAHRMSFSSEGDNRGVSIFRASLRSLAALAYPNFDDILDTPEARLRPMCEAAVDLAGLLFKRRVAVVGMPDWESAFDETGRVRADAVAGEIGQSVVHEFMVAANTAATDLLKGVGRPMIYRNQGARPGGPGGRYEIVCHGHAALGVQAYGQFSSPLRNYVNLVNQRALCAAIEGTPPPQSAAEHAQICAASNLSAQRADALGRVKAAQPVDGAVAFGVPLDRLDPFAFRRLLRHRGNFDWRTLREFRRRLDGGMLTHVDAAWLLFGHDSPSDNSLRGEILDRLAATPGEIERVWRFASDNHGVPAFEAEMARSGSTWDAAAVIGRYVGEASDSDPVKARNMALVRLAASTMLLVPTAAPVPGAPTIRFVDTRARKRLGDLCRLMGWEDPDYVLADMETDGRVRGARGQVSVATDTFHYVSPSAQASHRSAAEMAVAELAHAALLPYADDVLRRDMNEYGVDVASLSEDEERDGPVQALEDFCTRYGARQRLVWTRERPSIRRFNCALEIKAGETTLRAVGWGGTRDGARATAARSAIENLLGRVARTEKDNEPAEQCSTPVVAL